MEAIEGYLEVKTEQLKNRTRGEEVEVIVEGSPLSWRDVVKAVEKVGFRTG